jgi:hypothetical protein
MAEEAHRTLKWKILSLELEPGSFLNELGLTAHCSRDWKSL